MVAISIATSQGVTDKSKSYIAFQIPSNMILTRVKPSWYMAGFCLAWSIISLLTYLAHDYATMVGFRFLLGICEAPVRCSAHLIRSPTSGIGCALDSRPPLTQSL